MNDSIRASLVAARRSKGWTQEELAERTGITVRTVQRLESGQTAPRLHTLRSVATILDIPLESVIFDQPDSASEIRSNQSHQLWLVNLSAFSYLVIPIVHFLIPMYLLSKKQNLDDDSKRLGRVIVSTQIGWAISINAGMLITLAYNQMQARFSEQPVFLSYYFPFILMYVINAILIVRLQIRIRNAQNTHFSKDDGQMSR